LRDYPLDYERGVLKSIPKGHESEANDAAAFFIIEYEGSKKPIVKNYVEIVSPAEGLPGWE